MKALGPGERSAANENEAAANVAATQIQNSVTTVQGCPAGAQHDREVPDIDLLSPLTIRS
jgi:hypothetical protein